MPSWLTCVRAAEEKKSSDIRVLDLRPAASFTDFFVLCNGNNQRQCQAICDEVESAMQQRGERAISIEGYDNAEWILLDFGDLVVHVFTPHTRSFYDLERLWRDATPVPIPAP